MKNAAVICEFDPLHTGHEYLLKSLRERGAQRIVAIMSGDACQRGELSVFSKHTRARAALLAGADLVLELPFPYSAASAEFFAFGAMSVISALGCIDTLGFGCESGDAGALCEAARILSSPEFERVYAEIREKEAALGAAAQAELAYRRFAPESELLRGANNLLAIEYIKAAKRLGVGLSYSAVKRVGAGHGEGESGGFASASYIREKLGEGKLPREYLPESCVSAFESDIESGDISLGLSKIGDAVLSHFRLLDTSTAPTAESGGGLLFRMAQTAHGARDYAEFKESLKTKKYTDARLRRAVLFSLAGVRDEDLRQAPAYITLLGAAEAGISLLSEIKKTLALPMVSNPAMLRTLPECAERQKLLSRRASAIRSLTVKVPTETERELKKPPVLI